MTLPVLPTVDTSASPAVSQASRSAAIFILACVTGPIARIRATYTAIYAISISTSGCSRGPARR